MLDAPAEGVATLDDAYAVQRAVLRLRRARGERLIGWKLGYTSAVMREQMGVAAPNFGPLTSAMALSPRGTGPAGTGPGRAVPATALQPRVEPEILLRLGRRLDHPCTVDEVLAACDGAFAALEVVDSVWRGYRFRLEDNTADGSSAGWFAVGTPLGLTQLPDVAVRLVAGDDGVGQDADGPDVVAAGVGADAGGHPASGVVWLAEQLWRRYRRPLLAGEVVLTGGLTAAVPLPPGGTVRAEFADGGGPARVEVRRRVSRPPSRGRRTSSPSPPGPSR